MTPTEIQTRLKALAAHVGPKADANVYISLNGWTLSVHPTGDYLHDKSRFHVEGADWEQMFAAAYEAWDEVSGIYKAKRIRDMALSIIRITAETGSCSDAALRLDFPREDIARWGAEAVADADQIAGNGPFSIRATTGSNGAPDTAIDTADEAETTERAVA